MATPDPKNPKATTTASQNGIDVPFLEWASLWSNIVVVVLGVLAAIAGLFALNVAGVVLAMLAAIAGAVALYFSVRLGARKDADFLRSQLETAKIQEKLAPRTLSTEQRNRITERLKQFAGTKFRASVFQNDSEALGILYTVLEIFRDAGWIRRNPGRSSPIVIGTTHGVVGITHESGIYLHAPHALEAVAREVENIFLIEGFEIEVKVTTNIHDSNPERLHIEIGEKPRF